MDWGLWEQESSWREGHSRSCAHLGVGVRGNVLGEREIFTLHLCSVEKSSHEEKTPTDWRVWAVWLSSASAPAVLSKDNHPQSRLLLPPHANCSL